MGVDRDDVDHGARDAFAVHHREGCLHQEKRRLDVDGEHPVPQLRRGVGDAAAIGERRDIGEHIDAAKARIGRRHDRLYLRDVRKVGGDEFGGHP